jgi:hypothetical protein
MRLSRSIFVLSAALAAGSSVVHAQGSSLDKLTINGYLSQAYARSDSLRSAGISGDGTTDYRRAALLFRYGMSARESFVIQLSHRRLGDSPTMQFEDNVKLDWGFYQRKLASETIIRVGKAPIPMGIYNETRYVGTTLPFYRAPYTFYGEGAYTSETIEGLVLSQGLFTESAWRVDLSGYGGSYGTIDAAQMPTPDGPIYAVGEGEAQNVVGGQLWLATPITGLRVGGGGSRFTSTGGITIPSGERIGGTAVHVGAEGTFDRYALRAEAMSVRMETFRYRAAYTQGSFRLARSFWLNAQGEIAEVRIEEIPFFGTLELDWERSLAVGLNYQPASNLVWKNEFRWTRGYAYEEAVIDMLGPPLKGSHMISSLSVSF